MALIQESDGEVCRVPTFASDRAMRRRMTNLYFLASAVGAGGVICQIVALGHPIIAGWLAMIVFAWLFMLGASEASSEPQNK